MKHGIIALVVLALATAIGVAFRDDPYHLTLDSGYKPADQMALAHRDSPYSHVSWIISETMSYAQLRFFDKVEGGVCLEPDWASYASHPNADQMQHLLMPPDFKVQYPPADPSWPEGKPKPNPGTVVQSRYICSYPLGVLLDEEVMRQADGDPTQAAPQILIVGLGSGAGAAMLTHHFPNASITIVDIDKVVIEMVRDHYPFLRWLEQQTVPDTVDAPTAGKPRLRMVHADARLFVRHAEHPDREPRYDLILLDAYTSGSTIPPHLMTREFYAQCHAALRPGGIVFSNIIGSYTGPKHAVLGGAINSMRAAGLTHVHNFPVPSRLQRQRNLSQQQEAHDRNNIVLAADVPLDPERNPGWQLFYDRTRNAVTYELYPQFTPQDARMVHQGFIVDPRSDDYYRSCRVRLDGSEGIDAKLLSRLADKRGDRPADGTPVLIKDAELVAQVVDAVQRRYAEREQTPPWGWGTDEPPALAYVTFDGIAFTRNVFTNVVDVAASKLSRDAFRHQGAVLVGPTPDERKAIAAIAADTPSPTAIQAALREQGIDLPLAVIVGSLDPDHAWPIPDAPLFTDDKPNADILNH
ncbi:MAG: spermidine synthase [Planctomycetota bacterium]